MSATTRRRFLATSGAVGASSLLSKHLAAAGEAPASEPSNQGRSQMSTIEENAIRPFHIDISEDELVDLHRHIATTRWPDQERHLNRCADLFTSELRAAFQSLR